METAKLTALAALLAASVAGNVYLFDGETYEKVTLPPAPLTDAMVLTASQECQDEIKMVGGDPSCLRVVSYFPIGGDLRYPDVELDENGEALPVDLKAMRALNFEAREVWSCGGAVMPERIQDCLDAVYVEPEPAAAEK